MLFEDILCQIAGCDHGDCSYILLKHGILDEAVKTWAINL